MQEERETIAANLDAVMAKRQMQNKELAALVGAKPSQVSNWRRGRIRPGAGYLNKIAEEFGKTPGWFLDEHPPRRKDAA